MYCSLTTLENLFPLLKSELIWFPLCSTVNSNPTVKTVRDQPISRVECIRIGLHNLVFFITFFMAFVIERVFQPLSKERKTWFNLQYRRPVRLSPASSVSCFRSTSQYASLLNPYERGFCAQPAKGLRGKHGLNCWCRSQPDMIHLQKIIIS